MTDLRKRLAEVAKEIRSDGQYRLKIQGATNHGNRLIAWADSLEEMQAALDRALEDAERVPALEAELEALHRHIDFVEADAAFLRASLDAISAKNTP